MKLPESDTHFKGCKNYQRAALFQALAFVKNWDCAIDVGAHVGFFSKDMAGLFDVVHAFEPQNDNYKCLIENVPSNVVTHKCALGDSSRWVGLTNPLLSNSGAWQVIDGEGVILLPLDNFDFDTVDFIKIDVQAMEYEVLLGARETLTKHKPVLLVETKMDGKRDLRIKALAAEMGFHTAVTVGKNTVFLWEKRLAEMT